MHAPMASQKAAHADWLVLLAIILLGLNLRPILASVGPLLDMIQQATAMDSSRAGLLTTLPVLAMGLCALAGVWLQRWWGEYSLVLLGVAIIGLACAARWWLQDSASLIASAALGGLGIALVQTLLPSFIKRRFASRASLVMGIYSTAIMSGAAMAAASVAPLAARTQWNFALAFWALPALFAVVLWAQAGRGLQRQRNSVHVSLPLKQGRAWMLMLFFAIGTGAYTLMLAWLPPFYTQLGWSAAQSGLLLGLLTLMEVTAGILVSLLISVCPDRRVLLYAALGAQVLGLAALIVAPNSLALVAVVLIGLGIGAIFPLSLIVSLDHVEHPQQAGAMLSFVQGGGYALASLMPLLAGFIREQLSALTLAWLLMLAGVAVQLLMARSFTPGSKLDLS
ncbi:MFS transporter [Pseudomonas sp. 5P_3.1_Bac2]|uniref:MFS transporter n=1 Tax=Pseudomonas sp. 5P_3.1_Bac2 TaxID=2971617 RepID=UPI0021C96DCF|nr:MFS transporter [Pseudomonas sp. 5P_3.1_Bac2]MCU1716635.1 MFS transporter [Pseudomonas sp. 5P_3.1_Bac2]